MVAEARLALDRIRALEGKTPRPPAAYVEAARSRLPPAIRIFVILEAAKVLLALSAGGESRAVLDALLAMDTILAGARDLARRMDSAHLEWRVLAVAARVADRTGAARRERDLVVSTSW